MREAVVEDLVQSPVEGPLTTSWPTRRNRKQSYDNSDQGDLGNESSTISGFHKTGREACGVRPET